MTAFAVENSCAEGSPSGSPSERFDHPRAEARFPTRGLERAVRHFRPRVSRMRASNLRSETAGSSVRPCLTDRRQRFPGVLATDWALRRAGRDADGRHRDRCDGSMVAQRQQRQCRRAVPFANHSDGARHSRHRRQVVRCRPPWRDLRGQHDDPDADVHPGRRGHVATRRPVVGTRLDHDANVSPWRIACERTDAEHVLAGFDPATGLDPARWSS